MTIAPQSLLPPRRKRADVIVDEIKRWIASEPMQPGDRLPQEKELIAILKSSRGSVREALKVLESQGLIENQAGVGGGPRISAVAYERAAEPLRNFLYFEQLSWQQIYEVRQQLEPALAASVVGHLTERHFAALERSLADCRAGLRGELDEHSHRLAELEFHAILATACPNPLLRFGVAFVIDLLKDSLTRRSVPHRKRRQFACANIEAHERLVEALRREDPDGVRALMSDHVHEAGCALTGGDQPVDRGLLLVGGAGR